MKYYAVINGRQIGPVSLDELVNIHGCTDSTLVWHSGLPEWLPASQVSEIAALLPPAPNFEPQTEPIAPQQPSYQQQPYQQQTYQQPPQQQTYNPPPAYNVSQPNSVDRGQPYNWTGWAIAATVIGLLFYVIGAVPGIIGIVFASTAQTKYKNGNFAGAYSDNTVAKILTIIGLSISAICLLIVMLAIIGGIALFSRYY